MKRITYILALFILLACDSDSTSDCFQTSGPIIQKEIIIDPFENILVNRDIELIITEGSDYKIVIETGENLINDIEVIVADNELILTDNNSCNYVRDYGITKIYVTAPNIKSIRSSTQYDISSQGTLNFPNLSLLSEDFFVPGSFTVGDFKLQLNTLSLRVVSNNISSFYISGQVENLFIGFYSGAGRFEGESLLANYINVYHRGSNDMIVNPQESIVGELRGTGDLISLKMPSIVEVDQYYTGQLIFVN